MTTHQETFTTAFGPFSVATDETGAVVLTTFGKFAKRHFAYRPGEWHGPNAATKRAGKQLVEFFTGSRRTFDLPLAPAGTAFQTRVWEALKRIPYGRTSSYGELAAKVRKPKASRAVGSANGANPICVIIPCHRVISADGSLGGFGFGPVLKRRLLALEGVTIPS